MPSHSAHDLQVRTLPSHIPMTLPAFVNLWWMGPRWKGEVGGVEEERKMKTE